MTAAPPAPVMTVAEVTHAFGRTPVLHGVDLTIHPGTTTAIQGRSGSGKSTLLSIMMGLLVPTSGRVTLNGRGFSNASRTERARMRAQSVGVVFQHAELLEELTALQNVVLPAMLAGTNPSAADERARELLDELSVPADRATSVLSGGERQRVGVARALINSPRLVLADEPTGALDAELRDTAASLIFSLPPRTGCALVVVTHDPAVASLADRQFFMDEGRLKAPEATSPALQGALVQPSG